MECVRVFNEPCLRHRETREPLRRRHGRVRSRDAYDRAYRTDPTSAFGGIIAFNRELDAETATAITGRQFVEVIAAPSVSWKPRRGARGQAECSRAGSSARWRTRPRASSNTAASSAACWCRAATPRSRQPDTFKIVTEKRAHAHAVRGPAGSRGACAST